MKRCVLKVVSTIERPLTSIVVEPPISPCKEPLNEEPLILPTVCILLLNIAVPSSDISKVKPSMVEPPSCPLNTISLLLVSDFIIKLELSLLNLPKEVPPSFKIISVPSTSIFKSPPISKVKSPLSEIVEPSIDISSTVSEVSVPNEVTFG